jgi:predicted HTH domain antitoxin
MKIEVPEAVTQGLRLPEPEIERRLRLELALALYAQQILSFGKARELAGLDRTAFARLLTERAIPRHYSAADLAADLSYAHGQ